MSLPHPCVQVAILAGDYLLARASVTLGALRNTETVELMSQILEYLVSGEIMQARVRCAAARLMGAAWLCAVPRLCVQCAHLGCVHGGCAHAGVWLSRGAPRGRRRLVMRGLVMRGLCACTAPGAPHERQQHPRSSSS